MLAWLKQNLFAPLSEAYDRFSKDDGMELAASVAYYMSLSFFPLVLILLSASGLVLRYTGWGQDAQARLIQVLSEQTAPALANQVERLINSVEVNATIGGPLGLLGLLLASMAIFAQFQSAFDRIWKVAEPDQKGILAAVLDILLHRLRAFLMLLSVGALAIAAFLFNMALSTIEALAREWLPIPTLLWRIVTIAIALSINWVLFTVVYKALPKVYVPWRAAFRGGLLASVIWEIGRRVLAALVIGSKYDVYGVVGAFIAIMLWVYYAAASLFFGAEYVRVVTPEVAPAEPKLQPGETD